MESKPFTVYKSSAGSGKTYTLVKEYLKLVLTNPLRVGHILAITFTNAASAEMKERIIKALAEITALKRGYLSTKSQETTRTKDLVSQIATETKMNETSLLENSEKVLFHILHNYNDFSISTIDSFTHRILRTFAFDLWIPLNFDIEFDTQQTIEKAADILISKTGKGNNTKLTNLLVNFIESRTDEERSIGIEREIVQMASKMLDEDSVHYINKLKDKEIPDFLKAHGIIKKKVDAFQSQLVELGEKGLKIIDNAGMPVSSLAQGNKGIFSWFKKLSEGRILDSLPPNKTVQKILNENKWHSAKATKDDLAAINTITHELQSISEEILNLSENYLSDYILLNNVRNNLFSLALINEMEKIIDEIRKEENILFISDFNKKISDFIAREPIPFIYERIGEKYQNYMIDEFQDTSVLQWQNMLPLIENRLAHGDMSLLVGDAKQSIYRWRGGDAQQFIKLPKLTDKIYSVNKEHVERTLIENYRQIPENPEEGTVNYRSLENIVNFNNDFFETIKPGLPELVKEVYRGHHQKTHKTGNGGYVEISFVKETKGDKERFVNETVVKVQNIIDELVNTNYTYSDIAVLCRKKREAATVAQHLTQEGLYVVSEESLLLSGSPKVNFLISFLRLLNNPDDNVSLVECLEFLINNNLIKDPHNLHLCLKNIFPDEDENQGKNQKNNYERFISLLNENGLNVASFSFYANIYELFEEIVRLFFPSQKNIDPYLSFFFDCVHDYQQKRENSIPEFLRYWDENKNTLSLIIPDKLNAVKVITIHKSKGLQFPVVIHPFAKETVRSNRDEGFWIDMKDKDIPGLKVAYISAQKSLLETDFSGLYAHEEESKMLDLVNLTYVAFTRPQEKLFVISSMPESGKFPQNSLNTLLQKYLESKGFWNNDTLVYSFPEKKPQTTSTDSEKKAHPFDKTGEVWLNEHITQPWKNKVAARILDEPYEAGQVKKITRGKTIHKAMENISADKDIPVVLKQLISDGYIAENDKDTLEENIKSLIKNPLIQPFFSENCSVKTEPGIFDNKGNFYRPDRIAFSTGETAVIDYKTGKPHEKYQHQIRKYGRLLKDMGYKNIKLFIVYIDLNEIEEIWFQD